GLLDVAKLKDQMRKSSSLLQTLQASGQMIEGLVRSCFRDMQLQYGEKFGAALSDLNRRLEALEAAAASTSANGGAGDNNSGSNNSNGASGGGGGPSTSDAPANASSSSFGPGPSRKFDYSNTGFRGEPMTPALKISNAAPAEAQEMTAMFKALMDRIEQLEKK
ncbi:UNVERIFIED_CONTAM: hypothetical protein HDU68_005929, partial [Siphonaria sp. JEL0065]